MRKARGGIPEDQGEAWDDHCANSRNHVNVLDSDAVHCICISTALCICIALLYNADQTNGMQNNAACSAMASDSCSNVTAETELTETKAALNSALHCILLMQMQCRVL